MARSPREHARIPRETRNGLCCSALRSDARVDTTGPFFARHLHFKNLHASDKVWFVRVADVYGNSMVQNQKMFEVSTHASALWPLQKNRVGSTRVRVDVTAGPHGAEGSMGREGGFAPLELRHRALGRIGRRRDAALAGRGPRARQEAEQGRQLAAGVTRGEAAKALGRGRRGDSGG